MLVADAVVDPDHFHFEHFCYFMNRHRRLIYAMNRYYGNALGRFTTVDPLGSRWSRTPVEEQHNELFAAPFSPLIHGERFGVGAELELNPALKLNHGTDFSAIGAEET
jgi:hypothetical protein